MIRASFPPGYRGPKKRWALTDRGWFVLFGLCAGLALLLRLLGR